MATLSRDLRKALEKVVLTARSEAEAGARKALEQLAVAQRDPWPTMSPEQQALRRRLRARGRQLGDRLEDGGKQGIEHLVSECAYEQWHRMLFARFLAECELLLESESGVAVSVDECKELARERGVDWISLASSFAQRMLPQIFREDDAVLEIKLPAEHRQPLEQLLISLPRETFLADDSLGWVYQFWQSEEKERVNDSGKKIGPDELAAVTQLFTEDYMVQFLLDNTLGAWWTWRLFPNGVEASSEAEARATLTLPRVGWQFLRLIQNGDGRWHPAAGTFDAWPRDVRELRLLDPCMGSGHFLVAALSVLVALHEAEVGDSSTNACAFVLRNNLFGLEIDPRCTQIAAFNLALAAWKLAGWQQLPMLNVACSGLGPNARLQDWVRLAGGDQKSRLGMEQLYDLFSQAPVLGSLINPKRLGGDLFATGFRELQSLLEQATRQEEIDEARHELATTAQGIAKAAEILSAQFVLVATNVPYLGRAKQNPALMAYCERVHPEARADLATSFIERCVDFCKPGATVALVTPHGWLYLDRYAPFRKTQLRHQSWAFAARLGTRAFETISGEVVNVSLISMTKEMPTALSVFLGLDVSSEKAPAEKARSLSFGDVMSLNQFRQLANPDARIVFSAAEGESGPKLLAAFAQCYQGLRTGDANRFIRCFWEPSSLRGDWEFFQTSSDEAEGELAGLSYVLLWQGGTGELHEYAAATRDKLHDMHESGNRSWGKEGVAIGQMTIRPTRYLGDRFDNSLAVITPSNQDDLPAVWAYCTSEQYRDDVKAIAHGLYVTNQSLLKVPFDRNYWRSVADAKYSTGLPVPRSDHPTQWLFDGAPSTSADPLHVAVARLLGYRWPRGEAFEFPGCPALVIDEIEPLADQDGIVCLWPSMGEASAADRLSAVLSVAYGSDWGAAKLNELLALVGYAGKRLDDWLVSGFFEQHCELFHHRPFVWHVWDGRRDGFNALVNCHKLNRAKLERLAYGYLGDWIRRQRAAVDAGEAGSEGRLAAAVKLQDELKKILEGEPPYDIFVRWKPLSQQPLGWEPDWNDGVRVNIRPFIEAVDLGKKGAGVLRVRPKVKWDKDRGNEPTRLREEFPWFWEWDGTTGDFAGGSRFDGNRWNDLHYSREFKMAARRRRGLA